jgi:hypothetical protein
LLTDEAETSHVTLGCLAAPFRKPRERPKAYFTQPRRFLLLFDALVHRRELYGSKQVSNEEDDAKFFRRVRRSATSIDEATDVVCTELILASNLVSEMAAYRNFIGKQ